jgi:predicted Ser/Thr protein kinase
MKKNKVGELHLFIIWNKGRYKQNEILNDIQSNLTIIETVEVNWSTGKVGNNYSRFYGLKLTEKGSKIKECGTGPFLLITVFDQSPQYEYVETSRGHELVNTNIFALKQKYRQWTGGGHKIHSTNSIAEVNHDLTLLIGENADDYMDGRERVWNKKITSITQDLIGADGWNSLKEIFYVLNNTTNYFVMRNHEILPEKFASDKHGDIDIQVTDFEDTILIMNADRLSKDPNRVRCSTRIKDEIALWDAQYTSDNYYCQEWQTYLMDNRILNDKSIYVLGDTDYFYTLIYHAVVHKKNISDDYYTMLRTLMKTADVNIHESEFDETNDDFDVYIKHLMNYMDRKGYNFTKPDDNYVYFNDKLHLRKSHARYLKELFDIDDVYPTMLAYKGPADCLYYKGLLNGHPVFIKWSANNQAIQNEFKYANILYNKDHEHFVKPIFYKESNQGGFIVFEYIKGDILADKIIANDLTPTEKKNIVISASNILNCLKDSNCSHRDIRPRNILISSEGRVLLIDFEFAVSLQKYKEKKYIRRKPNIVYDLGAKFALAKMKWNDAHSFLEVIKEINLDSAVKKEITKHIDDISLLQSGLTVSYKNRYALILLRKVKRALIGCIPVRSLRKRLRK